MSMILLLLCAAFAVYDIAQALRCNARGDHGFAAIYIATAVFMALVAHMHYQDLRAPKAEIPPVASTVERATNGAL